MSMGTIRKDLQAEIYERVALMDRVVKELEGLRMALTVLNAPEKPSKKKPKPKKPAKKRGPKKGYKRLPPATVRQYVKAINQVLVSAKVPLALSEVAQRSRVPHDKARSILKGHREKQGWKCTGTRGAARWTLN